MTGYLAIDGGGTKTVAVLIDAGGTERARRTTTTSNPSIIGLAAATGVLNDLVTTTLAAGGIVKVDHLWAGLSGFGRIDDHAAVRTALAPFTNELTLTNDIELVLGAHPGRVGIAAIAGTGSIVAGRNAAGVSVRVGGWGHIFGDEGSGYFYGVEALRAIAAMVDGRGPDTVLKERIGEHLGIDDPFELIPRVYGTMDKAAIAGLSRHLMDAAYRGDTVALAIVGRGADAMATMIDTAARRLGLRDHLPLALAGGIYLHNTITRDLLRERLATAWPSIAESLVIDPATTAAKALASTRRPLS